MFLLAAAAIATGQAPSAPHRPVAPTVQAQATVRILSGVRLHFGAHWTDGHGNNDLLWRSSVIRGLAGEQPARLYEFQ
jgi:hypothetical protein